MTVLSKVKPIKRLLVRLKKHAGRNNQGRITVRHRGGGVKRLYRIIEWGQEGMGKKATVTAIEYDPYRTAYIMRVRYEDGKEAYRLAPHGIKIGEVVEVGEKVALKVGNRMKLKHIPVGTSVFNIELQPGGGGKLVRAAGTSAEVLGHEGKYTYLRMPSKEVRLILSECFATIGQVSNPEHRYRKLRKAGQRRLKGWRPTVRGSAMSPPDHPHAGGEGKAPIGLPYPKTPWGKPALGVKTRRRVHTDKFIIKSRHEAKK